MSLLGERIEDKSVLVVIAGANKGVQQAHGIKSVLRKA